MTPEEQATAYAAGVTACKEGRANVAALDKTILGMIEGIPVGAGAVDIFEAFYAGYSAQTDIEFKKWEADNA